MPSWFRSKSSTKDVKKKKSFENIIDGAKRKLKLKQTGQEAGIYHFAFDSGSETCSGAPSPSALLIKQEDSPVSEPQLHPLPSVPSVRTSSERGACIPTFPSFPLPSPGQSSANEDTGECISASGTGSTSSISSHESMPAADVWLNNGCSDLLFPSLATAGSNASHGFEKKSSGVLQANLSPRYFKASPRHDYQRHDYSHPSSPIPSQHFMLSPMRAYSGNHADSLARLRNGLSGAMQESPCRSPQKAFSPIQSPLSFPKGGVSPQQSRALSPRVRSPGPSSRTFNDAVSPIHSKAGGGSCDFWHENEAHPLPMPPTTPSSPLTPSSSSSSILPGHVSLHTGWRKGTLLGSGTFGQVYTGFHSESGQSCAIKEVVIIPDNEKSMESARQLMQEVSMLSQMKHPNIVQYYGSEMVGNCLYIYLELMSNGSIHKLIEQYGPLSENCIRVYTRQILLGLCYLHGKNTVHRDVKGANILVDKGGVVKLADFGMAKLISAYSDPLSFKGSPYWMAPEVIRNTNGYDFAVDIWSLGCTVLEMATGKPPWSQFEGIAAVFKIGRGKETPPVPESLSEDAKMFLHSCLQRDRSKRPTAAQLLEHPFVSINRNDFQIKVTEAVSTLMKGMNLSEPKGHSTAMSSSVSVSASAVLHPQPHGGDLLPPQKARNLRCSVQKISCGIDSTKPLHTRESDMKSPRSPRSPKLLDGMNVKQISSIGMDSPQSPTMLVSDGSLRFQPFAGQEEDQTANFLYSVGSSSQRLAPSPHSYQQAVQGHWNEIRINMPKSRKWPIRPKQ